MRRITDINKNHNPLGTSSRNDCLLVAEEISLQISDTDAIIYNKIVEMRNKSVAHRSKSQVTNTLKPLLITIIKITDGEECWGNSRWQVP